MAGVLALMTPEIRREGHTVVELAGTPSDVLDALLAAARLARRRQVQVAGTSPGWLDLPQPVRPDDHVVGEVFYRALEYAEIHRDARVRDAVDARAGYRRILDGVEADANDPLGLRYDLTHAPEPGTSLLSLIVTRNCQLRCTYCSMKLRDSDSHPCHIERAVDLLFRTPGESVRMQFYGGEPLLREDLVRLGVERGRRLERETGKRLAIVLLTNGIGVTRELAAWARTHDLEVLVSLDGTPEATNANRTAWRGENAYVPRDFDTHAAASGALAILRDAGVRRQVIITLPPERAGACGHAVDHVLSLGVTTIQVCYAMGRRWGEAATEILCAEFERILAAHTSSLERREWTWVNMQRREPLLVDTALQVETDGRICFMNECIFEKRKLRPNYGIASIHDRVELSRLGASRFHDLYLLTRTYSDRNPRYREILLDNIRVGTALGQCLARRQAPAARGKT